MYLQRLEVHGFKAFAERQHFEFGPGMSVIVGPNGSGKSNVADAIRWALGEQSSRQIRARKTEDVIFSGSDKRRQMGMAEVTLTLDNSDGWMPIDFTEVSVTRRAHRSGDNEYLINGQQVRLSDVLDLFRRAQVGQNSYAHMSQGLVDEVLALRPGQRRQLIEDAADLRRHRHQLTLSERRLSETRDNLGQVRRLLHEIEPRLRQLERQSRRAESYRGLASELSDSLQVFFEHELRSASDIHAKAKGDHDQSAKAFADARSDVAKLEERFESITVSLEEHRTILDREQVKERELAEDGLRLEQAVALAEQRLQLIGTRRSELEVAVSAVLVTADGQDDTLVLAELVAAVESASSKLAREREGLVAADEATRAALRELAEAEARRERLEAEREDCERRILEQTLERENSEQARNEAAERFVVLTNGLRAYRQRSPERRRAITETAQRVNDIREKRDAVEAALERGQIAHEEAAARCRDIEMELNALDQRRELLDQLTLSLSSAQGAPRAILNAAAMTQSDIDEPLVGVVDLLSRLIRVPKGLEPAIEAALAEQLSAVVVESESDAVAAIDYLRDTEVGSVSIYPLDRVEHVFPVNLFNERGVIGVAARLVRTDQKYRKLVDTLLGRVIVVDDLKIARQMVRRGLGSVVTRDGILLREDGSMYGGKAGAGSELFGLRRELEALPGQINAVTERLNIARQDAERASTTVRESRVMILDQRERLDAMHLEGRRSDQERARERRTYAQVLSELRALRSVIDSDQRSEELEIATHERLDACSQSLSTLEMTIAGLRDRSASITSERDEVVLRVDEATQTLASREAEQRSESARRHDREEEQRRLSEQVEQQTSQLATLTREQQDLELSLTDYRARLANNRSEHETSKSAVGPIHAAVAQYEEEERELSIQRRDIQRNLLEVEREMLSHETAVKEQALRVQQINEQVVDEGMEVQTDGRVRPIMHEPVENADVNEQAEQHSEGAMVSLPAGIAGGAEVDIPALRDRIHELRGEIRKLGPVNLEALEDLSEEEERHEFLTGQVDDLEAAETELRTAIRQLRRLIRERFVETFDSVNTRFGEYFKRFFGGGSAELRLLEDDDDADSEPGVEIVAQPPGKRISNLNILSGGERSMTSVALLFALLSVNPAPVVVLDEVDAALDEANVGRFVDTLRELRERTQFVVISHNRATIEAGDAIYGVSMADDSSSQVLSLLVDQAEPISA